MKRLLSVALLSASLSCASPIIFGVPAAVAVLQEAPTELTPAQIEKLVQPIALYPDLLLQQVLAASTFPDQILDAALYNEQGKDPKGISSQPWDDSVKSVANYPSVVTLLAKDLDWTITLGSTFINQTDQLRTAIQTLRSKAKTVGNLEDTQGQNVIEEQTPKGDTVIRIEPTDPQVVYIPSNTTVVYQEKTSTSDLLVPVASFGLGMALGYAMGDDDDDNHYYGGYYGPGFWHSDDAVNNWVDYRHDRWDDAYDYARDRQEWRQDSAEDWREHRQELTNKQSEWRNEARKNAGTMTPAKRAEAQTRLSTAKSQTPEQRQQALQSRASSSARVDQAKQRTSGGGSFSRTGTANYSGVDRSAAKSRASEQAAARRSSSDSYQQRARTSSYGSSTRQPSTRTQPSRYSGGSSFSSMNSGSRSMSSASARGSMSRGRSGGGGRGRR